MKSIPSYLYHTTEYMYKLKRSNMSSPIVTPPCTPQYIGDGANATIAASREHSDADGNEETATTGTPHDSTYTTEYNNANGELERSDEGQSESASVRDDKEKGGGGDVRGDKECIDEDNEAYEERLREAVRRTVLLNILRTSGTSMDPTQRNEIFQSLCNNATENEQSIVQSRGEELALESDVDQTELIVQYVRVQTEEEKAATATNSNDINLDDSIESIGVQEAGNKRYEKEAVGETNDINLDDSITTSELGFEGENNSGNMSIESIGSNESVDGSLGSDDGQGIDDDDDDSFPPSPSSDGSTNEQLFQAEAKIVALRETLQRTHVCHWLKRSQAEAFNGWINFVKEHVQKRRLVTRVIARAQRVQLVRGFTSWTLFTRDFQYIELKKREQEVRWIRAIKIMEKRVTSKVFASWISFISIRRRFRKYAKRMAQRKSLAVLKRWIEFVDEKLEMREKVLRAAKKFSFRKLAMGFASWKQHFQLLAQADQAKTNRTRRLKIVLRRLESRLLSKAYTKWVNDQRLEVEVQKVKGEILRSLGAAATKIQCLVRGYQQRCVLAAAAAAIQEEGESKEINVCDMLNEEVIAAMIKELHDFDENKLKELGVSDLNLESLLSIHETLQTQCSETSKDDVKKHLLLIPEYVQSMFRLKNAALEILAGKLSAAALTLKANAVESKKIDLNNFFELAKNLSTGKK